MIRDDQIGLLLNGELVDFFGVVGEDGTGTDHEFENGRASRLDGVTAPSPVWIRGEWEIVNDNPLSPDSDETEEVCAPGFFGTFPPECSPGFDPLEWVGAASLTSCDAPPPPAPPPPASPPPVVSCSDICGDIDNNGVVEVTDIVILNGFVLGEDADPCVEIVGDVSEDDLINVSDIVILVDLAVSGNAEIPTDCSVFV